MAIKPLPFEHALDRIEKEVNTFDEIYYKPKNNGVVNLFVPNHTKKVLHGRLKYLEDNLSSLQDTDKARNLITRMKDIGQVLGFDSRGYAEQENPNSFGIDLSGKIPTKEGVPFFAWGLGGFISHDIEFNNDIEESKWMERELGPIDDSRGNVACGGGGITVYTKLPNSIQTHGLSFHKKYVRDGSDARLSFDCGWNMLDGFMYSISFHMKDGKLVRVTDGRNETDAHTALSKIEEELAVSPQHVKAYIDNSNLTDEHRRQISGVINVLSTYPKKDVYELFDAQKQGTTLLDKFKSAFTRRSQLPQLKDASKIDLSQLRPHFEYVTVDGLETEDLKNTGLPDNNLLYASVSFKSGEDNDYHVTYQTQHPKGPYLFLGSDGHKDREDFMRVENALRQHISLEYDGEISDRSNDLCNTYNLRERPTQKKVAQAVDEIYTPNFQDVKVGSVKFSKVYEGIVKESPLPKEKIRTDEVVLI